MTAFKGLLTSRTNAIRYAFNPELGIQAPFPDTLDRWDALTRAGQRVVAIGNADAHGTEYRLGALKRTVFPYEFLFRQVNTHILTTTALSGDYDHDRALLLGALAAGHCFVAYDGAGSARGFRFSASAERASPLMGDAITNRSGLTLQLAAPAPADIRLLRDGVEIARWENQTHAAHVLLAGTAGVYRAELYRTFQGRRRGWIYSNPIYVRAT
jgi:hypothetical protein